MAPPESAGVRPDRKAESDAMYDRWASRGSNGAVVAFF
jgi:hypothetical protein